MEQTRVDAAEHVLDVTITKNGALGNCTLGGDGGCSGLLLCGLELLGFDANALSGSLENRDGNFRRGLS